MRWKRRKVENCIIHQPTQVFSGELIRLLKDSRRQIKMTLQRDTVNLTDLDTTLGSQSPPQYLTRTGSLVEPPSQKIRWSLSPVHSFHALRARPVLLRLRKKEAIKLFLFLKAVAIGVSYIMVSLQVVFLTLYYQETIFIPKHHWPLY